MMKQTILTFICEINPEKRRKLLELFNQIQANPEANPYVPFAALKSLHFASFVIIDDIHYGSRLIFENNFDGPLDAYLGELTRHAGAGLHEIYGCCLEYPAGPYAVENLISFLRGRVVRPNAFHVGNVGRSVQRIGQESWLRRRIEDHLDKITAHASTVPASADSLRGDIQAFTRSDPDLAWAEVSQGRQTFVERAVPWIKIIITAIAGLVLLPILIPVGIVWLIILRRKEKRDSEDFQNNFQFVSDAHIQGLVGREDYFVQNHLASVTLVKPGWFRRFTLRVVLWLARLLARTSNKGELAGIPTIHYAHWSLIDKGRRLLFLSNYGGSWGSYLDDFIEKASPGLTAIWSNTVGFPPAKFLAFKGARDGPRFKSFSRQSQTAAAVWYSAYPDLTVHNINNNSSIREDLYVPLAGDKIKEWLQRF
jgi:hypothetical protein